MNFKRRIEIIVGTTIDGKKHQLAQVLFSTENIDFKVKQMEELLERKIKLGTTRNPALDGDRQ
jgi:hypothetical protein